MKKIEVVAAIIYKDKTVFSAERGSGFLEGYFEFPGGKIEEGETPQEALERELYEELEIKSSVREYV
ncbi:MAG: NUDIX domain-containing protein, partial [Culicoidibacterales bacterium]